MRLDSAAFFRATTMACSGDWWRSSVRRKPKMETSQEPKLVDCRRSNET